MNTLEVNIIESINIVDVVSLNKVKVRFIVMPNSVEVVSSLSFARLLVGVDFFSNSPNNYFKTRIHEIVNV